MKWILILVWFNNGAVVSGQFGPFADKATCEAVKRELKADRWEGVQKASCALSSIDPNKLPQVETQKEEKK